MIKYIIFFLNIYNLSLQAGDLITASKKGDIIKVIEHINNGDNLEQRTRYSYTPLLLAIRFGHIEIVKLLINAGADVHARTYYGLGALQLYRGENKQTKLILSKLLLEAGVSYDNLSEHIETIIEEDPDIFVAEHFRKVLNNRNLKFPEAFTDAALSWFALEDQEKALQALSLAKTSRDTTPSNYDIAHLLGPLMQQ